MSVSLPYHQAVAWLLDRGDYERDPAVAYAPERFNLRRVEALLEEVDRPHIGPVTIHIAGTKGKGSTAAMIEAALRAAGYRTGLYTSPHLHSIRERIRVAGEPIAEEAFAAVAAQLQPIADEVDSAGGFGSLSTFELLTAMAFLAFRGQRVEVQVLETGMGGRLDATNVCQPSVCVLTNISLDHTEVLGATIDLIASEKGGIVKDGVAAVSAPQAPDAMTVFRRVCQAAGAPLLVVGRDAIVEKGRSRLQDQSFTVTTTSTRYDLSMPLLGAHQRENAACAVLALERIKPLLPRGLAVHAVVEGFRAVDWPGRLQVLEESPLLVVDGAHNVVSVQRLLEAVRESFAFRKLVLILGLSAHKDVEGIVSELAPAAAQVIVTRSRHPRSLDADALVSTFQRHGVAPRKAATAKEALATARDLATPHDLILATGSLFLVADMLAAHSASPSGVPADREKVV